MKPRPLFPNLLILALSGLPTTFVMFAERVPCNCGFAPSFDESTYFSVFIAILAGILTVHFLLSVHLKSRSSQIVFAFACFLGTCGAVPLASYLATGPSEAQRFNEQLRTGSNVFYFETEPTTTAD